MDSIFRQRKFFLACFFAVTGAVAMFLGKMGGSEFIALATSVLGLYAAANVVDKRNGNDASFPAKS